MLSNIRYMIYVLIIDRVLLNSINIWYNYYPQTIVILRYIMIIIIVIMIGIIIMWVITYITPNYSLI